MDIVYPLKRNAGRYDELRYSLRSLTNLPHDRVFLVGGRPNWVQGVEHIDTEKLATKYKDAGDNIRAACESDEISDPFVLFNDDFFVQERVEEIPVLNRGKVSEVEKLFADSPGPYLDGMRNTLLQLDKLGFTDPWSFELHVPMVVYKGLWLHTRTLRTEVPSWHIRTAYGAVAGLQGETVKDVKVYKSMDPLPTHLPFVSSSDKSFSYGTVGRELRKKFKQASPYEQ